MRNICSLSRWAMRVHNTNKIYKCYTMWMWSQANGLRKLTSKFSHWQIQTQLVCSMYFVRCTLMHLLLEAILFHWNLHGSNLTFSKFESICMFECAICQRQNYNWWQRSMAVHKISQRIQYPYCIFSEENNNGNNSSSSNTTLFNDSNRIWICSGVVWPLPRE